MTETPDNLRLLVVDDDAVDRAAVRRLLARSEATIDLLEAGDLPEARRLLAAGGLDAILLDQQLPGEDGLDFLRGLDDPFDAPPVIMLTGRDDSALAVAALKAGAADYLSKGQLGTERLTTTVGNSIASRRSERERRSAIDALERSHGRSRAFLACTQTLLLDMIPGRTLERALLDLLRGMDADRLALLRTERQDTSPGWTLSAQAVTTAVADGEAIPDGAAWRPAWHRWQAATATGEVLLVDAGTAPEVERAELDKQGVRRAVVVPFYLHGRWAGLLRCDRMRSAEAFATDDARFLQSAGDILTVWLEQREAAV